MCKYKEEAQNLIKELTKLRGDKNIFDVHISCVHHSPVIVTPRYDEFLYTTASSKDANIATTGNIRDTGNTGNITVSVTNDKDRTTTRSSSTDYCYL